MLSASAALGRLTGTYRYAYANEGRESGIGGERRIFLPKREGHKSNTSATKKTHKLKKHARNKKMYATYGN